LHDLECEDVAMLLVRSRSRGRRCGWDWSSSSWMRCKSTINEWLSRSGPRANCWLFPSVTALQCRQSASH